MVDLMKLMVEACSAATFRLVGIIAHAGDTPAHPLGTMVVSAEKTKKLQAKGATVADVRVANEYADAHIDRVLKNEIWWGCIPRVSNFSVKLQKACASLLENHAILMADNE